jgi:arylsulfatase
MLYTFGSSELPGRKTVQYYEMMGHRAIYADGWKAVTRHQPGVPFTDDTWELYNLAEDRSECNDLAAAMPEKLAELVELWWREAEEHGVLPLDERTIELFGARFRDRSPHRADRRYTYRPPMSPLPAQVGASIGGRSWDLDARIEHPSGAGGVIYATGTASSGVTLFVQADRLVFDYNCFGEHQVVESGREVPVGACVVGVRFRRLGNGGRATLVIDGEECGTLDVPFVMRIISSIGPSVGYDHGSPVSDRYPDSFPFEGTLEQVDIQLVSERSSDTGAAEARAIIARQ